MFMSVADIYNMTKENVTENVAVAVDTDNETTSSVESKKKEAVRLLGYGINLLNIWKNKKRDDVLDEGTAEPNLQLALDALEEVKNTCVKYRDDANLAKAYIGLGEINLILKNYNLSIKYLRNGLLTQHNMPMSKADTPQVGYNFLLLSRAYLANGESKEAESEINTGLKYLTSQVYILTKKVQNLVPEENESDIFSINEELGKIKDMLKQITTEVSIHERDRAMKNAIRSAISGSANSPVMEAGLSLSRAVLSPQSSMSAGTPTPSGKHTAADKVPSEMSAKEVCIHED